MRYDIFISYRREGGYDTAKHLYDLLVRDGYKVSFDIDTLRSGNFDTQLLSRIDQCKDFILIVDQHAFDRTLDSNFDPKKDWLRCELAYALRKRKNIIPIFLSGVKSFPNNLPEDIAGVSMKNGPEYNRFYFNDFYKTLKKRFLHSNTNKSSIILFTVVLILSLSCFLWIIFMVIGRPKSDSYVSRTDSRDLKNDISVVDSAKYYWGSFKENELFVKGLRRGVFYDSSGKKSVDNIYMYKCGVCFDISVGFVSQITEDIVFFATDENDIMLPLDTDFSPIGYDPSSGYDGAFDIFPDNQYVIGQCDLDNDNTDELIIAVRTASDGLVEEASQGAEFGVNAGIGINVFKLEGGKWMRKAKLNETTNVLPAYAKIVKNSVYIYWLRTDEKYTFVVDTFIYQDFSGRAFTKSDFDE